MIPDNVRICSAAIAGTQAVTHQVDIAIVGGGISGSLAAVVLGRAGFRVALLDVHDTHPAELRCEKLSREQSEMLSELNLLDPALEVSTPIDQMHIFRSGRLVARMNTRELGFFYQDLVNAVRKRFPSQVELIVGRVTDLLTDRDRQYVVTANRGFVEARLIILASGLGDVLRQKLGIRRQFLRDRHSLTVGFSIAPASGRSFEFPALTYYGDKLTERIAYISVFPIKQTMRANLFCYRGDDPAWVRFIREEPRKALFQAMPELRRFLGDFQLTSKVQARITDLYRVDNHIHDGVVLIGDTFQTTCPAAGNGITRVLTDVSRLCNIHVPKWFSTEGMASTKIREFYEDPIKQACDKSCSRAAEYTRSIAIENGFMWGARRWKALWRPRLNQWKRRLTLRAA